MPAAPQGDIEVVPQPAGEGHVPAAPEVLQGDGAVGAVEVLGEPDPQQEGDPDGDVRVAAEVGVDLHRVAVDGQQDLGGGVLPRDAEHGVDDGGGDVAGDDHLLEQPPPDEQRGPRGVAGQEGAGDVQLGQELGGAHDRSRHQVGEERQVDGEVQPPPGGQGAAVDVHHVADGLEGEEGDSHGDDHLHEGQAPAEAGPPQGLVERFHEEAVVLEDPQQPQVEDQGGQQHSALSGTPGRPDGGAPPLLSLPLPVQGAGGGVVDARRRGRSARRSAGPRTRRRRRRRAGRTASRPSAASAGASRWGRRSGRRG